MSTSILTTLHHLIGCTALGFYCIACNTALKRENVRRHLQRHHKDAVANFSATDIRSVVLSLINSALPNIEACLTGPIKQASFCLLCKGFFPRKNNFSRHLQAQGCPGQPAIVFYRDTICSRHHILQPPTPSVITTA